GSLLQKTFDEANELIELVATNQYMYSSERGVKKGVMEVHTTAPLEAMVKQISAITKKLEKLEPAAVTSHGTTSLPCGLCGGPHDSQTCSFIMDDQSSAEQVSYVECKAISVMMVEETSIKEEKVEAEVSPPPVSPRPQS
ncbi:hypothetical protein PIB30_103530, partial [Stylosanthes scabra]|nr:hypothetical protein [Stylosanthes scabra]